MLYKIQWTDKAIKTAENIVNYLKNKWTEKEVNIFLNDIDKVIALIETNPKLFKASIKRKNVHLALLSKHTFLVYQIRENKKQIILLLFWGTKQNPKKLKY